MELTFLPTGLITFQSRAAAEAAQVEESRLRTAFFGSSVDATAIRAEYGGDSEDWFQRWMAYKRGGVAGRIHQPRGGRIAEQHAMHPGR